MRRNLFAFIFLVTSVISSLCVAGSKYICGEWSNLKAYELKCPSSSCNESAAVYFCQGYAECIDSLSKESQGKVRVKCVGHSQPKCPPSAAFCKPSENEVACPSSTDCANDSSYAEISEPKILRGKKPDFSGSHDLATP
jgi:hypothetical protein